MASFSPRLRALAYPQAAAFAPSDPSQAHALYVWLEDRHIRQLPVEQRAPLRANRAEAVRQYFVDCQAPEHILAHLDAGEHRPVCSWLIGIALAYEYSDKYGEYEDAYRSVATSSDHQVASPSLLAADDPELELLAASLDVQPQANSISTLQVICKAARKLSRHVPNGSSSPGTQLAASKVSVPQHRQSTPDGRFATFPQVADELAPLGENTFPLGLTLGDAVIDDVARVLRMLHIQRLREMQDAVNAVIACMQEFTANPKTDARLGKVGH